MSKITPAAVQSDVTPPVVEDEDETCVPLDPEALAAEGRRTMPTEPPAWVLELKPLNPPTDGTNGMHRVFGALGDIGMTDEELTAALEDLS